MGDDCKKQILEHTISCNKEITKDRHAFRGEIQKSMLNLDNKIDKTNEKVSKVESNIELFTKTSEIMDAKIDKLIDGFDKFRKEMRDNMPSKKEVEENTEDLKELKKDRFKFIVYLLISAVGIISTLLTVLYNNLVK